MKAIRKAMAVAAVVLASGAAQAALIDRGGGFIYDTDLNITWLQDANYAKTSGYDADGLMGWGQATNWAASLTYGGHENWRLPTFSEADPTCFYQYFANACTGGELAHLINVEWAPWAANGSSAPFVNVQNGYYWSSTPWSPYPWAQAWVVDFPRGVAGHRMSDALSYAMAVLDGDVAAANVPEPSSVLLVGLALAGLGASLGRRFSRA